LVVEQKFTFLKFPENARVRAATSEFSNFSSVWWVEYGMKHPNDIPQTWIALKQVMQARFVPSYYARDLINKLHQLKQGARSVEEYYQELQIGMLCCNLGEREDAAMARFYVGLNREIQDILEYKYYANITRLFHFACKAERDIHGSATMDVQPHRRLHQVGWHRCKGFGHVMRDCPSKHVLVIRDDGEYSSASDFDEDTLALLADDHEGNDDHPKEHIGTGDADHYESLIVQCVLSTQMERVEQNQRHTLFQTKCVIKERSCRMIIDCGSCNNLASSNMVDKLALTTKPHPHPYHIQWLNNSGKTKVTKLVRLNFAIGPYHDVVECDVVPMQACHILLGRP
jgi:hypothetical protein